MCVLYTGIDVDIDVEHEGQRTKVTPPTQSGGGEGDEEMEHTSSEGGASLGAKVTFNFIKPQSAS